MFPELRREVLCSVPEIKTELADTLRVTSLKRTMSSSRLGAYDPDHPNRRQRRRAIGIRDARTAPRRWRRFSKMARSSTSKAGASVLEMARPSPRRESSASRTTRARFAPASGVVKKIVASIALGHASPTGFHAGVSTGSGAGHPPASGHVAGGVPRRGARLVNELGENAPGPLDIRLPPSAETLKATADYELIALGIRPQQARTLIRVAKHERRIEAAADDGTDELAALLEAIPGIGPWSIAYVLGSALGYPDAVLVGDYGLPHTVAFVLAGEERASDERMLELLEPFQGHRFRVIRLLWVNGVSAPRRGPRYDPG